MGRRQRHFFLPPHINALGVKRVFLLFFKQIAIFLRDQGYFAAVAVTPEGLLLTFRYVGDIAPFKKLIVVSKSSRSVYFRRTTRLPGVFLMSSSDTTLSLKKTSLPASGKVLIQIL